MLSHRVRLQIGAFVVIALLGVSYVGARYAGLERLFGPSGYVVKADLADSGGIFTNAEVTYRGVTVGRVGQLRLTADGIQADLQIDPSAPKIPSDTRAVVADRSAVGEQYVDLRPNRDGGPYLADGSQIAQQRTETPPPVEGLLTNLDTFAASVPTDSLRTVVDELDTAFQGAGPNLQRLLDSQRALVGAASDHLPQTERLLSDGRTVLGTQNDEASAIKSFSRDLATLAGQFKKSDPDLRGLITSAPQAGSQFDGLLRESGHNLGVVVANLLTTSNVFLTRTNGLEQVFVTYPLAVAGGYTVVPGDGTAHFGMALNSFDPPPCTKGYEGTQKRPGNATNPDPLNTRAYCAEPAGSPSDVRGAQNAPRGGRAPAASAPSDQTNSQSGWSAGGPGQNPLPGVLGLPGMQGPTTLAQLLGLRG
ncbi:MCE family protein [Gandjariella thermophila]|uniref:ABC transporter substrate-binding protein n=1 Tax=Gandjariella thermophila TaxID=1931992 RepID=A0A4D4J5V8_9PSEU|nr:MlaD family protein [Gandjariella thermophila]GDY29367.1 ABC transporter substrate-binding protein [Gandjariella thermophila]